MNDRSQKYTAPILILVIILLAWEGVVNVLQIEQFLLPKPSAIVSNLVQVIVVDLQGEPLEAKEIQAALKANKFIISIPVTTPADILEPIFQATLFQFSTANSIVLVTQGGNLKPILQAAWFTLKEALGGLALGGSAGVLMALATARWTTTREALLPFAIAANSMPIIAFAPIMNNWFGLDNPFSKMAIVAIMVFFPMMINTVRGLTSVEVRSLELMRSYAAGEFEILRKLRLPNALPYLFNGLKVAAALSMIGAIVGEYFGGPRIALGVFITQEAALFRFASAWSAIIIACLMGITLYLIIILAERLLMPWHVSFR